MDKCLDCGGVMYWNEDTGQTCYQCGRSGYRHQPTHEELNENKKQLNSYPMAEVAPLATDCPDCLGRGQHTPACSKSH